LIGLVATILNLPGTQIDVVNTQKTHKEPYIIERRELSPRDYLAGLAKSDYNLLRLATEIIRRESNWQPEVCNKRYGCMAGQGLFQLIPSTVAYCEKKLKREIDPLNAFQNLDCGWWLLVNEGIRHWEDPNGEWGAGPY